MESTIYKANYDNYLRQIAGIDFSRTEAPLGIKTQGQKAVIPFFDEKYIVSNTGISDEFGNPPDYMVSVILFKYLLLCPDTPIENKEWAALKDFHKLSQFTNLNVFTSDAERPIVKRFSCRIDELTEASKKLGGKPSELDASYDFSFEFCVLPRISILLLFNDGDDEFPATCSVLFQRQAENYLDPESLIMVGIAFARRLIKLSQPIS